MVEKERYSTVGHGFVSDGNRQMIRLFRNMDRTPTHGYQGDKTSSPMVRRYLLVGKKANHLRQSLQLDR
jgi:hypothetical protein